MCIGKNYAQCFCERNTGLILTFCSSYSRNFNMLLLSTAPLVFASRSVCMSPNNFLLFHNRYLWTVHIFNSSIVDWR